VSIDVVTFGCRLNTYESEVIRRAATTAGVDGAIVVNTCAVTAEAVRQARQTIRRLKREQPDTRIIVTGCAGQTEAKTFAAMPEGLLERAWWRLMRSNLHLSDAVTQLRERGDLLREA